jgi:uncharacterized protein YgiM (DUF1202 family)
VKRFVLVLIISLLGVNVAGAQNIQQGKTAYIAIKNGFLKSTSGVFASEVGGVNYGDRVTVLQVKRDWAEVRPVSNPTIQGWITVSSLTTRNLAAASTVTSMSANELALAGKGFSVIDEKVFSQREDLDYSLVDGMESYIIPSDKLRSFLIEGHLNGGK